MGWRARSVRRRTRCWTRCGAMPIPRRRSRARYGGRWCCPAARDSMPMLAAISARLGTIWRGACRAWRRPAAVMRSATCSLKSYWIPPSRAGGRRSPNKCWSSGAQRIRTALRSTRRWRECTTNWVCRNLGAERANAPCLHGPGTRIEITMGTSMSSDATEALFKTIDERRDELVELTRALIRFPTVNPPGQGYLACAGFIGELRRSRGFAVDYVHAAGTPGDSERYPRINVIARRAGTAEGPCVHFNSHIDVVQPGSGWTVDPFTAVVK